MSLVSRIMSWLLKLPQAETHDILVSRNMQIPMPDGVILPADHYAPRSNLRQPTILIRTPYGRNGTFNAAPGFLYAERGFQVLIQDCRGTGEASGDFRYARNEQADGLATIAWIKQQPWFSGQLAMIGRSYSGFAQWAIAAAAGTDIQALVPKFTTSNFSAFRFQGNSLTLETIVSWLLLMGRGIFHTPSPRKQRKRLSRSFEHLPLCDLDQILIDRRSEDFQDSLRYHSKSDYWRSIDYSGNVGEIKAPIYLIGGWYDVFLAWQLQDYQALRAAGQHPFLLIGPWHHRDGSGDGLTMHETLAWLDAHLKRNTSRLRDWPVRVFLMGARQWRDFPAWPPPAQSQRWYLHPERRLAPSLPPNCEPDRYRYNPADPTPAVGGNTLGSQMGPQDNRALEARPDVLSYTSAPLAQDLQVVGPIRAELFICTDRESTDFFVRLCVVETSGLSINLCDGIERLHITSPGQGKEIVHALQIDLWPTAYSFRPGQRVRVQVSSGAHPRFVRNLGGCEPLATATKALVALQTVYHDPAYPSAIVLPILNS